MDMMKTVKGGVSSCVLTKRGDGATAGGEKQAKQMPLQVPNSIAKWQFDYDDYANHVYTKQIENVNWGKVGNRSLSNAGRGWGGYPLERRHFSLICAAARW